MKRKEAKAFWMRVTGRDPVERLLKALSNTYLQAALQQRQRRLSDGLDFLRHRPHLYKTSSTSSGELANFRTRYSLLGHRQGSTSERETAIAAQVLELEAKRNP